MLLSNNPKAGGEEEIEGGQQHKVDEEEEEEEGEGEKEEKLKCNNLPTESMLHPDPSLVAQVAFTDKNC